MDGERVTCLSVMQSLRKGHTMNNNTNKSSMHPMILTAAAAVVLVSGVGVAAMMGWLPSSESKNQEPGAANVAPIVAQQDARRRTGSAGAGTRTGAPGGA
jgi:hypothetical protein